jgi:hypothetical protein
MASHLGSEKNQRNFRLLTIEARPAQSQQSNQSYCQADGYISARARVLANASLSTDDVGTDGCETMTTR